MKNCGNTAKLNLEVGAHSETGYVRIENQDRMSGTTVSLGHIYIVADGMGGHKGGAVAAELTIKGLQQHIGEAVADASVEAVLKNAFEAVNTEVHSKATSGDSATEKMGSTAVLVLIRGMTAWLAHVGDSRAYLYRNGTLDCLTQDHTWVQMMVEKGMLKAEDAPNHPNSSQLSRAIGHGPGIEVDIGNEIHLRDGDAIILCSDGLTGYVSDPEIVTALKMGCPVQQIPEQLVQLALKKGGEDNVTVQFIQCGRRPDQATKTLQVKTERTPKETKTQIRRVFQWILAFLFLTTILVISYLNQNNIQLQERAASLNRQISSMRATMERMEKELAAVEKDVAMNNDRVESAKGDRNPSKREYRYIQNELKETKEKLKAATSELAKLKKTKEDTNVSE